MAFVNMSSEYLHQSVLLQPGHYIIIIIMIVVAGSNLLGIGQSSVPVNVPGTLLGVYYRFMCHDIM